MSITASADLASLYLSPQVSLPGFGLLLANQKRKAIGGIGESYVIESLRRHGVRARLTADGEPGDVRAVLPDGRVVYVEVKTARRGRSGTWQFCLYRALDGRVCTSAHRADVIVLLGITAAGLFVPFVFPASFVSPEQKKIAMRNLRSERSKYAQWRSSSITLEGMI